jgi:putative transposase
MTEILALLQNIALLLDSTVFRQMSHVIFGMLVISGRITMLGLSRWTEKGGSYRTIQRFFYESLPWKTIQWLFFQKRILKREDEYVIFGDEVVISKAGKKTYGVDYFFSGLQQQVIPGLSLFVLSLANTKEEHSYPMQVTQIVKTAEEKAASKAKAEAKKVKKPAEKRKLGRPKGSKNKEKQAPELNPELLRIQTALKSLLETAGATIQLTYLVMDGHFGNYPSAFMVRGMNLHLISKLRSDAALCSAFEEAHPGPGPKPKYGEKIDVRKLDEKYRKEISVDKEQMRLEVYQRQLHNKEFAFALNVVILVKTNLKTQTQAHIILFSTDLELPYEKIIKLYTMRFKIEFNFRDAKQYWGLEDFMNVKDAAVTNAVNLSFFMVNFSSVLSQPFRDQNPDYSILDLKSNYRGRRYVSEIIKMLPKKPDDILLADIFEQIAQMGAIHSSLQPADSP